MVTVAAGSNWSTDGRYNIGGKQPGTADLFAVAEGGLQLNRPTVVREKLQQTGDAPAQRTGVDDVVPGGSHYPRA